MYPIFDPKSLSDADLDKRIFEASNLLMAYRQSGHNALIESMEMTLAVMEEEKEYRMFMKADALAKEREKQSEKAAAKRKGHAVKKPVKKSDTITIGFIKGVDDV